MTLLNFFNKYVSKSDVEHHFNDDDILMTYSLWCQRFWKIRKFNKVLMTATIKADRGFLLKPYRLFLNADE